MKAFTTRLKEVDDKKSALKKLLVEENRMLYKSFSGEIKKLEQRNHDNDSKIELYKRKLISLKEDKRELAEALREERSKSRLTIKQLLDDAEQVMMDAKGIKEAANATIHLERQHATSVEAAASELLATERQWAAVLMCKEQQNNACQITECESFI